MTKLNDRVVGIIAEYNPFHKGHLYHLKEAKKKANADIAIAIITGNFTQRGVPSLVDKWTKTEMILKNGIDLVIELPTIYSISSAENVARGSIKILNELKIIDAVAFGNETYDINTLNDIAEVLAKEPHKYKLILNNELKKGISFPKARENAVIAYLNNNPKYYNILTSPNNTLAIEYLKTLKRLKSPMKPIAIHRYKVEHNDKNIIDNITSATKIRELANNKDFITIRDVMPLESYKKLIPKIKDGQYINGLKTYEKEIIYILRKMSTKEIANLPDVNEGLENAIKNAANSCNNLDDLINIIKSKRYTQTRIQRILCYALLGITKKEMKNSFKATPYIRILGFNEKGKSLLSSIVDANPKVNLVTSVKKYMDSNPNKKLKQMLKTDIKATNIYTLGYSKKAWANLDYTKRIIIDTK